MSDTRTEFEEVVKIREWLVFDEKSNKYRIPSEIENSEDNREIEMLYNRDWKIWQAATSQQAERIAQQDEIIAELVEALEAMVLSCSKHNCGLKIADDILAKVKGVKSE